jgi:hypothetical protein
MSARPKPRTLKNSLKFGSLSKGIKNKQKYTLSEVRNRFSNKPEPPTELYSRMFIELENTVNNHDGRGYRGLYKLLEELSKIEDKYIRIRNIYRTKQLISISYSIICDDIIKNDILPDKEIKRIKKDIHDSFYDGRYDNETLKTRLHEIIDIEIKGLGSLAPLSDIILICYLYYRSLVFSSHGFSTPENYKLVDNLKYFNKQRNLSSTAKSVSGKLELTEENKQRLANRKSKSMNRR